ncbi:MAG: mannosyltransferase family protein [bacterium]|nr:mannosyltransferase family protein [bacterium]
MKLFKSTRKWLSNPDNTQIILFFLAWRIWTIAFALLGLIVLPLKSRHFLGGGIENYLVNPLLWGWANFDGEHYLSLAASGYREFLYFFFPLYPNLIKAVSNLISFLPNNNVIAGILISNLSFSIGLLLFWKLVTIDFKRKVAVFSTVSLLVFPTSFFLGSIYTEGLFFLLAIAAFYSARRGNFLLAGVFTSLASATKIAGILLVPALVIEWLIQERYRKSAFYLRDALFIIVAPLGLFLYMFFLWEKTGNAFIFYEQVSSFGEQRAGQFVFLPQVFWRYLKILVAVPKSDPSYLTAVMEILTGLMGLVFIVWGILKRMRFSYLLFLSLGYILPTLTGSFSSLPRYILTLFPMFILLGLFVSERGRIFRMLSLAVSAILLAIETALFIRGYWVA